MPKSQFNLSIDSNIKEIFSRRCDAEGRDCSKMVQILIEGFINDKIIIQWDKKGGTIYSIKK